MIRRCATSIEAEGIQRPHANTSQVILFFSSFLKFYCSFFSHSGHSGSRGATARVHSRAWILMLVEEQTWGLLLQSRNLVQGPGDLTTKEPSFTAGLQQQPEITVRKLVSSFSLAVQKVWAFLHTPQPRANSSPVGGWTTCKGHSVPSSCLPLGPVIDGEKRTRY